jgi:hypothetical protein
LLPRSASSVAGAAVAGGVVEQRVGRWRQHRWHMGRHRETLAPKNGELLVSAAHDAMGCGRACIMICCLN